MHCIAMPSMQVHACFALSSRSVKINAINCIESMVKIAVTSCFVKQNASKPKQSVQSDPPWVSELREYLQLIIELLLSHD